MFSFLLLHLLALTTFINCNKIPNGYYWRDYAGIVPDDAYIGGVDHNGRPIYIGQTIHEDCLVTVKLYSWGGKGYYPFGYREHVTERNIKVLCTREPSRFRWIRTTRDSVGFVSDGSLVIGGSDHSIQTYIGRMFYKLESTIGKVISDRDRQWGLLICYDGDEITFPTFEVLVFYPYDRREF